MIDYDTLKNWKFPPVEHTYTCDTSMLYALSVGVGADCTDERQLRFVNDTYPEQMLALPTLATILGFPGSWMSDPATGITFSKIVHGEESVTLHAPLPVTGTVIATHKVTHVIDKGTDKGALIRYDKHLSDKHSGQLMATVTHTTFARADGGFSSGRGKSDPAPSRPEPVPTGKPHKTRRIPTLRQQALLYRLLADRNPLHSDPNVAKSAGFSRPILHGLCTYGIACTALLDQWADYNPLRLSNYYCRFSAPVLPGETLEVQSYEVDGSIRFRVTSMETGATVLDAGTATFT